MMEGEEEEGERSNGWWIQGRSKIMKVYRLVEIDQVGSEYRRDLYRDDLKNGCEWSKIIMSREQWRGIA